MVRWFNAWSIHTKIISGFLIIVGCLTLFTVVVHNQIYSKQNEVNVITTHDRQVTSLTNQIEKSVLDMENGMQGYVITGDPLYLDPYKRGKAQWQQDYDQLYEVIAADESGILRLQAIKGNIDSWVNEYVDHILSLKQANNALGIAESFRSGVGIQQVDIIRQQFDAFRDTEKQATDLRITAQKSSNSSLVAFLYLFAVVVAGIALVIAVFLSRSILSTLRVATSTIQAIALSEDNLEERITVTSKDEIGDLAHATNLLLDSHQQQYWIQTLTSDFAAMYQGIEDTDVLADLFLTKICTMLNGQYGALYLLKGKDLLLKAASYAGNGNDIGKQSFKVGDGLVGQCAKERTIIHINQIPGNYIRIESGLGEAQPEHILLVPVEYQGSLQAVIEIASMEEFNELQLRLLDSILGPFAAAADIVKARMEIDRLYAESQILNTDLQLHSREVQSQSVELQTQSEELRLQSEELQAINGQLQEQRNHAQSMTAEAEKAKSEMQLYAEQLTISSQYKSEFLANMSHELRTPLNSMLIFSQFLKENHNQTLTEEELQYAGYIQNSGNDLLTLINDILDLSKVEAGKMSIHVDPVNISELPQTMEQHFSALAAQKGLEFTVSVAADTPDLMYTDEQRLQQILKNLISNAIKFTEAGKVEVTIQSAQPAVLETLENVPASAEGVITFTIRDTGMGIPEEKQQLIFESFRQADGTVERNYGGTGLGLSISKQLTALLGGELHLISEPGAGSVFTLILPSLAGNIEQIEVASAAEFPISRTVQSVEQEKLPGTGSFDVLRGKKVMIVDDDKRNTQALMAPLTHQGMKVFVADSGKECLQLLEQEEMDIILMDIMMPEMNGYQVMKTIRNSLNNAELPIIAVTAKAMNQDRDKSLAAGASDYLSKPIDMNRLFSLMRVWLTQK
ncbi:response regulator [Paenibacillus donghaensis]|uniref:response regulator n=1 Tax=Paenibacillus donghaensis TaxID=414771 RepID=UPI0014716F60|nr:response regulator [Paenibacillus donghaensis]